MALTLADLIHENQGTEVTILDVSGPLAIADFFVIATARNSRHAQATARILAQTLKAKGKLRRNAAGLDGDCNWILLDFDEVVVHMFTEEGREFYALESLWADVPVVPFTPKPLSPTAGAEAGPGELEDFGFPSELGPLGGPGAGPGSFPDSIDEP